VYLHSGFDLSYLRTAQEKTFLRIVFIAAKQVNKDLDLLLLPAGLIRSAKKYKEGSNFSTYDLKSIFAFGLDLVFFTMNKKRFKEVNEKFSNDTGKGSYP
jgi:hypothetical protein